MLWTAWLLRQDGRDPKITDEAEAQRDFLCWWVLIGRREYKNAAAVPPATLDLVFQHDEIEIGGRSLSMPLLFASLWRRNETLGHDHDPTDARGYGRFVAHIVLVAAPAYDLAGILRKSILAPAFAADEATPQRGRRWLTRLERYLWDNIPALQQLFDIEAAAGQDAYTIWLETGGYQAAGIGWLFDDTVATVPVPPPALPCSPKQGGVNLIGFAYGQLGVGEDVRMLAASLEAAGTPFGVVAKTPVGDRGPLDRWLAAHAIERPVYDVSIFCMAGFDTGHLLLDDPALLDPGYYRIGFWPWELPYWPSPWQHVFDLVDEIWAATAYTKAAYDQARPGIPVELMKLAVDVRRLVPCARADFGLTDDRFLFLYVFDANSYLARKNPLAAIAAFARAFPAGDEPVALVLKMMGGAPDDPDLLACLAAAAADRRIVILDGVMNRGDVLGLIASADAYISLHRAEGFGRTIAEAMLLGRPVIATGFSGSNDLVTAETALPVAWTRRAVGADEYPFGEGQYWADPDIDHAASCLRRIATDPVLRFRLTEAARRHVAHHHAPARVGAAYAARLDAVIRQRSASATARR